MTYASLLNFSNKAANPIHEDLWLPPPYNPFTMTVEECVSYVAEQVLIVTTYSRNRERNIDELIDRVTRKFNEKSVVSKEGIAYIKVQTKQRLENSAPDAESFAKGRKLKRKHESSSVAPNSPKSEFSPTRSADRNCPSPFYHDQSDFPDLPDFFSSSSIQHKKQKSGSATDHLYPSEIPLPPSPEGWEDENGKEANIQPLVDQGRKRKFPPDEKPPGSSVIQ